MRRIASSGALALAVLSAGACVPAQAQSLARPGTQTGAQTGTQTGAAAGEQLTPQAGAPTPQQAQKAQESRSDAEAFLQRAEAATGSRSPSSDLAGSASASSSGADSLAADAPPPYGPVLHPRKPLAADPASRDLAKP